MRYATLLILLAALAWSGCFHQVLTNMSTIGILVIYTSNAHIYSDTGNFSIKGAFIVFPDQSSITITGKGNYWKIVVNGTKHYSANAVYSFRKWVVIANETVNLDIFCFNDSAPPPHSAAFQSSATPTTSAPPTAVQDKEGGVLEKMLMFIVIMSVSAVIVLVVALVQRRRGRIGEIDEIGI